MRLKHGNVELNFSAWRSSTMGKIIHFKSNKSTLYITCASQNKYFIHFYERVFRRGNNSWYFTG